MLRKSKNLVKDKCFFAFFGVGLMLLVCISLGNTPVAFAQNEITETSTPFSTIVEISPTPKSDGGKIVGGAPATPGEWPWQVALVHSSATDFWNGQFCGGTLVAPQWVVTAAHCVDGETTSTMDVIAGIYDLWSPASGYQKRDVVQIISHPGYNPITKDSDIALLQLATPVTLGGSGESATALLPLVSPSVGDLTGTNAWVTGWGYTESIPEWPDQLYEVQVPIIANSLCNDANHYEGAVTSNMMCAGYDAGGKDSCQGDSGGPLVVQVSGQWRLAGVVSWGAGCAEPYLPGIYTRVSNFASWVYSNMPSVTISGNANLAGTVLNYVVDGTVKTVTADSSGNYSITLPYHWIGTVTPFKLGYTFTPSSITVSTPLTENLSAQNFVATPVPYFAPMGYWTNDYNYNAQGWRANLHPRVMGDVNGDNKADIIGFGYSGVLVALSTGTSFESMSYWTNDYNYNTQGWRAELHPRMVADVNGDKKADIVGFGNNGVLVALSTGTSFEPMSYWTNDYNYNAQGWRANMHPRVMGDVNGDEKADIIGFGYNGVLVALSTGTSFEPMSYWTNDYNYNAQGWRTELHPRMVADVNGDKKADLIGFGYNGVLVALSTGTNFAPMSYWTNDYNYNAQGWRANLHPRVMGDVNGDGKSDIIGFGYNGVLVALSTGSGFAPMRYWTTDYNYSTQGWRAELHPRMAADVNGDKWADLVGFGYNGVLTGLAHDAPVP